MNDVDRIIHEPARLAIMALLSGAEQVDFLFLLRETGLTKGNLSSHLAKLEEGEYLAEVPDRTGKPVALAGVRDAVCDHFPCFRSAGKKRVDDVVWRLAGLSCPADLVAASQ